MTSPAPNPSMQFVHVPDASNSFANLTARLTSLHSSLLERLPGLDRISCVKYDKNDDLLKTFFNSTRSGHPITRYEYKLSASQSLSEIVASGAYRIIDDIPDAVSTGSTHSNWLLAQGYRSSMTVPLYENDNFFGLLFFDSTSPAAFTPLVQRDVLLFCNLINMAISNEMSAVRSVVASAHIARDFANLRDFETGAHLERMARYSRLVAKAIAPTHGLNDEFIEHVFLFAPLHDIGKIGIPDRVLLKPGRLDPEERTLMESHVEKGVQLVDHILGDFSLSQLPDAAILRNIVGGHHEWIDGSGYPKQLAGDSIPIEARIVTTADIFDALTSQRPYKPAWSVAEACAELKKMADGKKLDPDCVSAMISFSGQIEEIKQRYQDMP